MRLVHTLRLYNTRYELCLFQKFTLWNIGEDPNDVFKVETNNSLLSLYIDRKLDRETMQDPSDEYHFKVKLE